MTKYTIELRSIVESGIRIFDFNYPFYDENKRHEFEEHFIRHFYFREIGSETIDRFKHYLEDKMITVFPYYNKLFETTLVEYDLTNNYNVTETHTINRENKDKMNGISSDVGQYFGNQTNGTEQTTTTTTSGNDTEKEVGKVINDTDETSNTTTSNSNEVNTTKSNSGTKNGSSDNTEKYLDTPQGLTDINDANYLTSLKQNEGTTFDNYQDSETIKTTEKGSGTSNTTATSDSTTDSERTTTRNTSLNDESTTTTSGSVNDEQKTTHDNNTRSEHVGSQLETFKREMYGNIGVQTATDMLEKHLEYQKKITQIEKLFFAECEDLFMLIW